ncbi:MAG: magnesium transporter, partial [Thermoplasmata archaeon]|nr:magnesium transporter [Thermoplasmata archaeon]
IFSILILSVIVYSFISIFVFGISRSLKSIFMIWSSAFLSIFLILIISYYLTVGCLRLKLDPDNVVVPIITTLVDIIGTISIILFYTLIF